MSKRVREEAGAEAEVSYFRTFETDEDVRKMSAMSFISGSAETLSKNLEAKTITLLHSCPLREEVDWEDLDTIDRHANLANAELLNMLDSVRIIRENVGHMKTVRSAHGKKSEEA